MFQRIENGDSVDAQLRKAEELFTFIEDAKKKFKDGSPQDRRMVLSRLGSNLEIESKKLNIDMEMALLPIQKLSPIIKEIHDRLEPKKDQLTQGDYEAEYLKNPLVLAWQDAFRTFEWEGAIAVPEMAIRQIQGLLALV